MKLLEDKILSEGRVIGNEILKVDSFLNHQIDVQLLNEIGKEFKERFKNRKVTKILTIEASGIGIACITAQYFNVPVLFAKKVESKNLDKEVYETEVFSFTKNKSYKIMVSKRYLTSADNVLIIDDFLANGKAIQGLKEIVDMAGAELAGVGIVIEKGFQGGRKMLAEKGIEVNSLAVVRSMSEDGIEFQD